MLIGFDTERPDAAAAACLVYSVYRARDVRRFKVDMDMWNRIERFTKASAKRAASLAEFVERLKPRLSCEGLRPLPVAAADGVPAHRDFLIDVLGRPAAAPGDVLRALYRETSLCVLLVRERLEREKLERAANDDEDLAETA